MTTTKSTAKIAARKKIGALALALGAGVLGTGFAAGVIDIGPATQQGFGSGAANGVQEGTQVVDVTGQLTVNRPMNVAVDANAAGDPFTATQGEQLSITGWENLQNAAGGTYTIMARAAGGWVQVDTGTVPTGGEIKLPARITGSGTGERPIQDVAVSVEK